MRLIRLFSLAAVALRARRADRSCPGAREHLRRLELLWRCRTLVERRTQRRQPPDLGWRDRRDRQGHLRRRSGHGVRPSLLRERCQPWQQLRVHAHAVDHPRRAGRRRERSRVPSVRNGRIRIDQARSLGRRRERRSRTTTSATASGSASMDSRRRTSACEPTIATSATSTRTTRATSWASTSIAATSASRAEPSAPSSASNVAQLPSCQLPTPNSRS